MKICASILIILAIAAIAVYSFFTKERALPTTTTTLEITTTTLQTTTTTLPTIEIFIHPNNFEPSEISIKSGGKLKWLNVDNATHEVVCVENGKPLFDAVLEPNDTFEFLFSRNSECWDPSVSEQEMRMKISVSD
jgi:plastocyanin